MHSHIFLLSEYMYYLMYPVLGSKLQYLLYTLPVPTIISHCFVSNTFFHLFSFSGSLDGWIDGWIYKTWFYYMFYCTSTTAKPIR